MKKIQLYLFFILFIIACKQQQNCPPCTNCNTTITYQVVKPGSDSLIILYSEHISGYYEGCALTENATYPDTIFTVPGTYNLKVKGIIGGFANISGTSKEKGWVLKILSASGNILATTENKPYYQRIDPVMGAVYENSLAINY